jgi:voltage-gated potassium channel
VTSETAGRLLGLATDSPDTVDVVEDLMAFGSGLDIVERDVTAGEVGHAPGDLDPAVLVVLREGRRHYFDDPAVSALRSGDRLVQVQSPRPDGDLQAGVR